MPTIFLRGDLFATPEITTFAQGCNCAGAMGKGIALVFRERWPEMYRAYRTRCREGLFGLGDVFLWEGDDARIFNLGTQRTWGVPALPLAIECAVLKMLFMAEDRGIAEIGMPRIGAGLGRLDWPDVAERLESLGGLTKVRLLVCDEYIAGEAMSRT